jgi:hypothetical protein
MGYLLDQALNTENGAAAIEEAGIRQENTKEIHPTFQGILRDAFESEAAAGPPTREFITTENEIGSEEEMCPIERRRRGPDIEKRE